ncbi:MAG: CDGSH iron-sulfur domain-containing protein, partial [Chloroflexi bacterium]|nr:CDGSH iron-sulfur domain-containing protein [Chloroflexota bacterium]
MEDAERRIVVRVNGPYRVEGGVPLLRTAIVKTDRGEPTHWDEGPRFEVTTPVYDLCRCGASATKPFCDGACETAGFDGTETADRGPIAARRSPWEGDGVVLYDDGTLCTHAGFCRNLRTSAWDLADEASDPEARREFVGMVHQCPSGRLTFAEAGDPSSTVEPALEPSIGVEPDASYWVRGGVPVVSEDGTPYEVRNRQTLCRCGHSRNKPFCDGSHKPAGFEDPAA